MIDTKAGSTKKPRSVFCSDSVLDRIPPRDTDSEVQVLGSILARPQLIDEVVEHLTPEEFYDTSHQRLFQCLVDLREKGKYCDVAVLVSALKAEGIYEVVGGGVYLVKLRDAVATWAHWKYHARIIREHAVRRHIIEAGLESVRSAYDDAEVPVHELISEAQSRFEEVANRAVVRVEADTSIQTILGNSMAAIDRRMKGEVDSIRTGFCGLDRIMGGVRRKELTVIGARPSQGKSSVLSGMACRMADNGANKVLFISLEMASTELCERMLCFLSGVNTWRMRNGTMTTSDREKLIRAASKLRESSLWVPEQSGLTVSQIASMLRRQKRNGGCDVLMVDYLQLIVAEHGNKSESRQQQIGRITRKLKQIAKEFDVAVIVAAQVNRENAKTESAPKLHHLREAGDIEADADIVVMCHMPGAYDLNKRPKNAEDGEDAQLIVEKNRNGPTGQTDMWYRRSCARWEDKADNEDSLHKQPDAPRYSEFDDFNGATSDTDF